MENLRNNVGATKWINGISLLLFFIGIGIYLVAMPKYIDDYWFMAELRPWFAAQGIDNPENGGNIFTAGFPWKEIYRTWEWHYLNDNVRIANCLAPIFLIFPKWVGSSIALLALVYAILICFRLVGIDWKRSGLVVPGLLLYFMSVPWYDNLGSIVFQFNYVLPKRSALTC